MSIGSKSAFVYALLPLDGVAATPISAEPSFPDHVLSIIPSQLLRLSVELLCLDHPILSYVVLNTPSLIPV